MTTNRRVLARGAAATLGSLLGFSVVGCERAPPPRDAPDGGKLIKRESVSPTSSAPRSSGKPANGSLERSSPDPYHLPRYVGPRISRISGGCAILTSGEVRCFDGPRTIQPEQLNGAREVRTVGDGGCAVFALGVIRCWGEVWLFTTESDGRCKWEVQSVSDFDKHSDDGAPERPMKDGFYYCMGVKRCATPAQVAGLTGVSRLALGTQHACAVTTQGNVFCWGTNRYGEGPGERRCRPPPGVDCLMFGETCHRPMLVRRLPPMKDVAVGIHRSCGVARNGRMFCWGMLPDFYVRAGYPASTPVFQSAWPEMKQVAMWPQLTCGLAESGHVYCQADDQPSPERLPDLAEGVELAAADGLFCIRTTSGAVFCKDEARQPAYAVPGITSAVSISARGDYACAVLDNGSGYCWGRFPSSTSGRRTPPKPVFSSP